ncbi:hypothetical protein [Streptomyces sp. NPDC093808]|uniref:hypothetical protein n=1 Tax=Streptomyces sp. NPDC093808 TaxID=3154985 RepID=UPI00344B7FF1
MADLVRHRLMNDVRPDAVGEVRRGMSTLPSRLQASYTFEYFLAQGPAEAARLHVAKVQVPHNDPTVLRRQGVERELHVFDDELLKDRVHDRTELFERGGQFLERADGDVWRRERWLCDHRVTEGHLVPDFFVDVVRSRGVGL